MIYLAGKASFSVHMNKIAAADVVAFWTNPKTGDSTPIGRFPNTDVKSFSTPDVWEDALLILEAADRPTSSNP